jgi:hypothetical protein
VKNISETVSLNILLFLKFLIVKTDVLNTFWSSRLKKSAARLTRDFKYQQNH